MFPAKRACALLTIGLFIFSLPLGTSNGESEVDPDVVPDQVVILFRDAIPDDAQETFGAYGEIIQHVENLRFITLRVATDAASSIMDDVRERPDVEMTYHPGRVYTLHTPNDPLVPAQWAIPAIGMEAAWDISRGTPLTKIAILDTGTQHTHEDLNLNTALVNPLCGPDYSVFGGTAADDHFHGTHVAGTVAGITDNAIGVAGMTQSCIQTVKVLNSGGGGTWEGVAEGIDFATTTGAHIISMSLGGGGGSPTLEDAVHKAEEAGVFVIAAAGNSGCWWGDSVLYPARYESVMAVGALQAPGDTAASFSSCGPAVEISAPGANIVSAKLGGGYSYLSGTSMATPHVSGVAGLMKSVNPLLTNAAMRCILTTSADDLGSPGRDEVYGWGRLDAAEAVQRAAESLLGSDPCVEFGLPSLPIELPL